MKEISGPSGNNYTGTVIDVAIKLGAVAFIVLLCFRIIFPFVAVIMWAVIIAVAVMPMFTGLSKRLGNKDKTAAVIITLLLLLIIMIPVALFAGSLVDGILLLKDSFSGERLAIPPPDESVKDMPIVGGMLYGLWESASTNLSGLLEKYSAQILKAGSWILNALMNTGMGMILFLVSIVISGVSLATSDGGIRMVNKLFIRLAGDRGQEFADMSVLTIRNVAKGVLGVSFIQALLAGIFFLLAGVPYSGLWALLCLIFGIMQLGPGIVIIPVMIYLYYDHSFWVATLWSIPLSMVMVVDNILKPIFMGKGASVPMLIVFLGSLGGFMAFGFIGLFAGAIILSLGYKLFIAWIEPAGNESTSQ